MSNKKELKQLQGIANELEKLKLYNMMVMFCTDYIEILVSDTEFNTYTYTIPTKVDKQIQGKCLYACGKNTKKMQQSVIMALKVEINVLKAGY